MRAIVQSGYGSLDVLSVGELPVPEIGDDEVLLRVRAASVHPDVWHVMSGRPYAMRLMGSGLRRPKNPVPGTDVAGVVEAVGAEVNQIQPGHEVFGEIVRGHQWKNGGAFAEYAAAAEGALAAKPANITFEEAAAVPTSGKIALRSLRGEGRIATGQRVLVNGAGGGVGVFGVQLAKAFGTEVTAVDHGDKLEALASLGADYVIDYTAQDYTAEPRRYDLILDVAGSHSFADNRRVLEGDGTYVLVGHDHYGATGGRLLGGAMRDAFKLLAMSPFRREVPGPSSVDTTGFMDELADLLAEGRIRGVVDRTFRLDEVAEAMRYLMSGQAVGKIVLTV